MTEHPPSDGMPAALRMQLRGLRREAEPQRDLWPPIAARLAEQPRAEHAAPVAQRPRVRALPALAGAAVLALALGVGWQLRPAATAESPVPPVQAGMPAGAPLLVLADAMTREYQGALREIAAAVPATAEHAALSQLDDSAVAVREALQQDPDAHFLLQRLQRVYAQRLSLTQRLARA